MAIEILILSGARQGERIVLDAREFAVGADRRCEVFFDPRQDAAAKGRSARFRQQQDGWYIHCTGGEVLVNYQPVTGWTRVRFGDVVRMSESGPDFSFGIASAAAGSAAKPPPFAEVVPASALTIAESSDGVPSPPVAEITVPSADYSPGQGIPGDGRMSAPPSVVVPDARFAPGAAARPNANPQRTVNALAIMAVGGLIVVLVILAWNLSGHGNGKSGAGSVVDDDRKSGERQDIEDQLKGGGKPSSAGKNGIAAETRPAGEDEKSTGGEARTEGGDNPRERGKMSGTPPADKIAARLNDAVFLVQVERSGGLWPHATCVAIGGDTLLTAARYALDLAGLREQGYKVWVTRPAAGFKAEVQDIRVNAVFATLADKQADWIYFNLGLLTVADKLPKTARLASRAELDQLEEGLPVAFFGFTHEGEKVTRFNKFEPCLSQGTVKWITVAKQLPGAPQLLHVKAAIPKNASGSPLVDGEGTLLGLYGEPAPPPAEGANPGAAALANLHYCALVNPEMINRWLKNQDEDMWPRAVPHQASQKPKTF